MDHHLAGEGWCGQHAQRLWPQDDHDRYWQEVPRDRQSSFDPQLIAKYQRCFPGFDDKIISMYARGMSTPEIAGHLCEL